MANTTKKQEKQKMMIRIVCGIVCVVMLFSVIASIFFI